MTHFDLGYKHITYQGAPRAGNEITIKVTITPDDPTIRINGVEVGDTSGSSYQNAGAYHFKWRRNQKKAEVFIKLKLTQIARSVNISKIRISYTNEATNFKDDQYASLPVILGNPFHPLSHDLKQDPRLVPERKAEFDEFSRKVTRDSRKDLIFVLGVPGIGKTTFLERWRQHVLVQERKPWVILISQVTGEISNGTEGLEGTAAHRSFEWMIDKGFAEDLVRYKDLLGTMLKGTRKRRLLSSLQMPDMNSEAVRVEYESGPQRLQGAHLQFLIKLHSTLSDFYKEWATALGSLPETVYLVLIVDSADTLHFNQVMHLLEYFPRGIPLAGDDVGVTVCSRIVISRRYSFDVTIKDPTKLAKIRSTINSRNGDRHDNEFRPKSFNRVILDKVLSERLPEDIKRNWWGDEEKEYLIAITDGNSRAVEHGLFWWWEQWEETQKTAAYKNQHNEIVPLILSAQRQAIRQAYINDDNALDSLLEEYLKAVRIWSTDGREETAVFYLQRLVEKLAARLKRQSDEQLPDTIVDRVLDAPSTTISRLEWQQALLGELLDSDLIDLLKNVQLIVEEGGKYRLAIPVLCIPLIKKSNQVEKDDA